MMVNPKRMGLKAGCTIRRKHPERLCFLGGAAQAFAAIASFAALCFGVEDAWLAHASDRIYNA